MRIMVRGSGQISAGTSRQRGFTVVELLTVIAIMTFLLSVIVVVSINQGKTGRIRATQKLIERLGIALAQYKAEMHALPPDTGYGMPITTLRAGDEVIYDSGSLWRYLGQEVVQKREDGSVVRTFGPYTKFLAGELVEYDDGVYGKSYYVVDSWNTPIGYVGDPRRVIHNRGDFDLYSAGPNRKTAGDDGLNNDEGADPDLPEQNNAYQAGGRGTVREMGEAALNGTSTSTKKNKVKGEVLDDINNWDPQR
jgi:prepilin-type N-terminal cleavage/methylation domain-containing protein